MNRLSTHIIPKFYTMDGGGGHVNENRSDSMGTEKFLVR